ncbi:MAG: SDR family oxidoreductase [Sandaracinaceae bacterium]|nr:SDR family oxidoreductase [Sandaracinaceae bacterium]
MSFSGRVSVVTGAASGIGRALALELAERGSDLAVCDIDEAALAETASLIERRGRRVTCARVDVASREEVEAFRDRVLAERGRVDAIVNNAGVAVSETVADLTYEDLEWIMGINFWGVVYGTKAYLPHLLAQGDGWVVNVSSVFGLIGVAYQGAYNATKFAVRGFTEALRQELRGTGVTSLSVHPGGIKTNIARSARMRANADGVDAQTAAARFDRIARTTPEQAAKVITDAMAARKDRVLVGPDAYLIDAVQRTLPVGYGKLFGFLEERLRKP